MPEREKMNIAKIGSQNICSSNKYILKNTSFTASRVQNESKETKKSKSSAPIIFTFMLLGAIFASLLLKSRGK